MRETSPVMTLKQLIPPWDHGKMFVVSHILLSYILPWFYNTNISKHLHWQNWKRRQPDFRFLLLDMFSVRWYGFSFHSNSLSWLILWNGSVKWRKKIRSLHSGEEFLLQLIVAAGWHRLNVWNLTTSNVALSWAFNVSAARQLQFLCASVSQCDSELCSV